MTRLIATFGFVGFLPGAAGAWGSLVALPLGYLLHWTGGPLLLALATLVAYGLGHWATRVEAFERGDLDLSHVVIDDVVGQWIALLPLSAGLWFAGAPAQLFPWPGWVAAFVLFRIFDVWKPGPVGWADRRNGPTGVMLDDVLAGVPAAAAVTLLAGIAHGGLL